MSKALMVVPREGNAGTKSDGFTLTISGAVKVPKLKSVVTSKCSIFVPPRNSSVSSTRVLPAEIP